MLRRHTHRRAHTHLHKTHIHGYIQTQGHEFKETFDCDLYASTAYICIQLKQRKETTTWSTILISVGQLESIYYFPGSYFPSDAGKSSAAVTDSYDDESVDGAGEMELREAWGGWA